MARIVGAIATSHVPAIGRAIATGAQDEPYWRPFFDGFPPVREWLADAKPDVVVVFYNDHGLNFFLDKMPTFAIGAADEYRSADEGWGIPISPPLRGDAAFSWHLIESLVHEEFDLTTCQEMLVDHAVTIPMALLWPDTQDFPVPIIPMCINTVQFPIPSTARCRKLGEAVGRAVRSYQEDLRVVVLGTGGLSHQLEGQRAGFINKEFDLLFMESLLTDPAWATQYSSRELVELAGIQGVELIMWIAARSAIAGPVRLVSSNYHIPISNTAAGLMLMEPV